MEKNRLEEIKERAGLEGSCAAKILQGDRDNYDGADGARTVQDLCEMIEELIEELDLQAESHERRYGIG